ncbi:MAG: hypothetical protein AAF791_08745 [Bacteroidota bacterium]
MALPDTLSSHTARWAALLGAALLLAPSVGAQPFEGLAESVHLETTPDPAASFGEMVVDPTDTASRDSLWDALLREMEPEDLALLDTASVFRDTTENLRPRSVPLTVFGYYRFFGYGRTLTEPYPNLEPFERAYGVGDGYREPMLSVTALGRPNGRSSFGTEVFVFTPYDGQGIENNTVTLNLGINFYGNFRTEAGSFGVRAGGIHWYNLSPFTIGVYQVLDRFSIFDRTPWEGVDGEDKYQNYFETGQANPGDARWNFQAFQGLILNGGGLPGDVSFDAFWGKTQPNGGLPNALTEPAPGEPGDTPVYIGLSGDADALPSFITGGRIARDFGSDLNLALNTLTSYRTLDSLSGDRRQYQVHTAQVASTLGGVQVDGEFGASLFESPTFDTEWGEALMLRAQAPADLTRLPLDVQVYQVGRHFFNENGEIATNNNPDLQIEPGCAAPAGAASVGGLLTQVNQLAHNRRGINVNTAVNAGAAKFAVGWGLAHELAPTTTEMSYVHRINGLAMSRVYNPFPADAVCATQFGPLGRKFSFFRGAFERVPLTDVDPVTGFATNRKYYHAVDIQAKTALRVVDRPVYLFYLGSFGSANPTAQIVPRDDDTYLFTQYHEFDAYVGLTDRFILTGYLGIENARGGQFTEISETTGEPRDQLATGIGVGFDWTLAPNAGLYFRQRWIDFEDRSFPVDATAGHETTLELKIFF